MHAREPQIYGNNDPTADESLAQAVLPSHFDALLLSSMSGSLGVCDVPRYSEERKKLR
jgi:hypothetical protein